MEASRTATETDLLGEEEEEQLLPDTTIVTHCIYKNDPQRLVKCFEDDTDKYKEVVVDLLNERDDEGKSPLDLAACLGRVEITRELLARGADVHNFTPKGYSCLHYAAAWGRLPVLKLHVEHEGNLHQRNTHGERPMETAQRYTQQSCVDYLEWAEAKQLLQETIKQTQEAILDADKAVAGRITKEEKNIALNTCKEKQEWLDNQSSEASTQDFHSHRHYLLDVVTPVVQKLSEPPPEKGSAAKPRPRSTSRPKSSASRAGSRQSSAKFNPQKGKKGKGK